MLGHMFPFYMHFHGGRGLACLGGVILAYRPRTLLLMLGIALVIALVTNYVCIATVAMSWIFPACYAWQTGDWIGAGLLAVPAVPILWKHGENFRRIRAGKELRFSFLWNREAELLRIGRLEEEP